MSNPATIIRKALNLIHKHGWISLEEHRSKAQAMSNFKEQLSIGEKATDEAFLEFCEQNPEKGMGYCMLGAVKEVTKKDPSARACTLSVLNAYFQGKCKKTIEEFNDDSIDKQSIIAEMEAAADACRTK